MWVKRLSLETKNPKRTLSLWASRPQLFQTLLTSQNVQFEKFELSFQIFFCPVCDTALEEHGVDAYCKHVLNVHKTRPNLECQVSLTLNIPGQFILGQFIDGQFIHAPYSSLCAGFPEMWSLIFFYFMNCPQGWTVRRWTVR